MYSISLSGQSRRGRKCLAPMFHGTKCNSGREGTHLPTADWQQKQTIARIAIFDLMSFMIQVLALLHSSKPVTRNDRFTSDC